MNIIGIDPGPRETAFVIWDCKQEKIWELGIIPNEDYILNIRLMKGDYIHVIEMVACFGMPVGKEVFETCLFIGRILEASKIPCELVYRREIKLHFCGSMRAKDGNVRQALIDRFGEPGTKKNMGKLYGVRKDEWSALAIAVYWGDTHK